MKQNFEIYGTNKSFQQQARESKGWYLINKKSGWNKLEWNTRIEIEFSTESKEQTANMSRTSNEIETVNLHH